MPAVLSVQKRWRAATFPARPGPTLNVGRLDIRWASGFDWACFVVTNPNLPPRYRPACARLMRDLTNETGCTGSEIVAHGRKVRAVLFFAEEQLARSGELDKLPAGKKYVYELPAVRLAF